jgi:hypothetical protein
MVHYRKLIILSVLIVMFTWSVASSGPLPIDSLLPKDIPEGWTLIDGPHLYTKKNLFKHINGQAELFFKYGFQKSIFAIYQNKKNQENQIELDIYDMGNVLQAFGIFSRFRNEDRSAGIGLDSYLDAHSALFYKGKYFVMLYSTESNPSVLKQWAMKVALKIVDTSLPPQEIGYFPKNGLKPGSIQYFPEGLLGYQFLKRGFKGTYIAKDEAQAKGEVKAKAEAEGKAKAKIEDKGKARTEDKEFHLFIAIFKDSQEAMSALKVYRDDLSKKGRVHVGISSQFGSNTLKGEDPYHGQVIIVYKGSYLLGVVGFEREEEAENRLAEFMKEVNPAPRVKTRSFL